MGNLKDALLRVSLVGALAISPVAAPAALAEEGAAPIEEVVVVGSRRAGRSATDSPVPVDVVTGDDFQSQGTSDMDDLLRNLLPSYNVSRYSISDAATITRPANLRGLPPDNTLILVNGKRRHRGAVIAELGGSLTGGSQGPDVSVVPSLAIDRVEVLRDGAAAQYGSDAIAGVINFVLKEDREGITFEGKWGEYYEGDGELWQGAINAGLPLGDNGFANVTFQVKSSDPTDRSLQRTDAAALIATGNTAVENPAQVWGAPDVDDDYAFFLNSGIELTESQELYAFGNYAERKVRGGFFFRNPNNRANVFTDNGVRAIMDTDLTNNTGLASNCPALPSPGGTPTSQAAVDADNAAVAGLPSDCFLFNEFFPGGFTPTFGGDVEDISGVLGLRGSLDYGLSYDFSVSLGRNEVEFFLENTVNPSLGPDSPTEFSIGKYIQTDQNYNANFVYPVNVDAFYSDLNVAFGAEYRVETFEIRQGEEASWQAGEFAFQNQFTYSDGVTPMSAMSIGANGFAGFGPSQVGEFERANYAVYVDLEADVLENLLLGVAMRYEDFDDFGDTTNGKLSARWQMVPSFALRGSVSTGFRAPTPGQSNVTKVSTRTVEGVLRQSGQIPPTNPIALFLGGEPLDAEDATNYTVGLVWDATDDLTFTVDVFRIELDDRISQTGQIDIADEAVPAGVDCPGATDLAQCLEILGIPGASDLTSVSFFTNDFDTTTNGIDLVATYALDWGDAGITDLTAAWNYTETEVDRAGTEVSRERLLELEKFNPKHRGIFTARHSYGDFGFLVRANYYDDWVDGDWSADPSFTPGANNYTKDCTLGNDLCYGGEWLFDAEVSYTLNDRYTFVLGGQNIFDQDAPDEENNLALGEVFQGNEFANSSPWGFDGGFYYFRFVADLY
jgi:iron complex outermembrane receptor protein